MDNTYLFAFEIGDSPGMIEDEYVLSVVPEGYELYKTTHSDRYLFTVYKNGNKELVFTQTVKSEFNPHINTEGFTIEEIIINDCDAICVEFVQNDFTDSLVIWDNGDYILQLSGDLSKNEMMDLAISAKVYEN